MPEIACLVTVKVLAALVPKQLLDFTEILPVVKAVWKLNVAEVVPCPETNVALAGAVHTYELALETAAMV